MLHSFPTRRSSILTNSEALKLLARAFWYVDTHPQDVVTHPAPERRAEERPGSIPLSRLPFLRVGLSGDGAKAAGDAEG